MLLNQDEKDAIHAIVRADGFPALKKVLQALVSDQEQQVNSYNLSTGDLVKLGHLKCRAEGAKKLVIDLLQFIDPPKGKTKTPLK